MKPYPIASIHPSTSDKTHTDPFKFQIIKTTKKSTHETQFSKHLTNLILEGDSLIQIQKWWDAIR